MFINSLTIFDPIILATIATIVIAILAMRQRQKVREQRRASSDFSGPAEPPPDPGDAPRPRRPFLTALHKRLLIALGLILVLAFVCWKLLPLAHIDIPWWVPVACFVVILAAALGTAQPEDRPDPDGPIPFRPDPSEPPPTDQPQ